MATYRMYFLNTTSAVVTVDAEDEESAIDAAYDELPQLCAHCTGWGSHSWSRDEGEWELDDASPPETVVSND